MTQHQIADALGITRDQVRSAFDSGMAKLRKRERRVMLWDFIQQEYQGWEYVCQHECNLDFPWQTTDGS